MQPRKALGKGLASLIPEPVVKKAVEELTGTRHAQLVPIDSVIPNRLQPRQNFTDDALESLSRSIKEHGIIQPLIVTPAVSGRYELIAGERRLRAARMAGISEVPVVVKEADPETMLEWALIENVQREDLNPIEEAQAYKDLIEEFDFTQDEVADKVAKSRSHVANVLRLLFLPKVIQEDLIIGRLTAGHARALLSISDLQEQLKLREEILQQKLSVRDVEKLIHARTNKDAADPASKKKKIDLSPQLKAVVEEMTKELGTKVRLIPAKNNKGGQLIVEYYSVQDLNRVFRKIVKE